MVDFTVPDNRPKSEEPKIIAGDMQYPYLSGQGQKVTDWQCPECLKGKNSRYHHTYCKASPRLSALPPKPVQDDSMGSPTRYTDGSYSREYDEQPPATPVQDVCLDCGAPMMEVCSGLEKTCNKYYEPLRQCVEVLAVVKKRMHGGSAAGAFDGKEIDLINAALTAARERMKEGV